MMIVVIFIDKILVALTWLSISDVPNLYETVKKFYCIWLIHQVPRAILRLRLSRNISIASERISICIKVNPWQHDYIHGDVGMRPYDDLAY